ncbi:MAG: hypothetical protein WC595_06890 [Candidatus Nanoarchaeia archaeon]
MELNASWQYQLIRNREHVETSPEYLREIASGAALEVDNYSLGREDNLAHVEEVGRILERHQLTGETIPLGAGFPYLPLVKALTADSKKEMKKVAEVGLEMRLFRAELAQVRSSEHLPELRAALVALSKEMRFEANRYSRYRELAA